jgi:glycogen operon protein
VTVRVALGNDQAGFELKCDLAATGRWSSMEGSPAPLGVRWVSSERAFNFALYSRHASEVALLLCDARGQILERKQLEPLVNKSGRIWHCRVPEEMASERFYGFSVNGPNDQSPGHRFDSTKILVDPYAPAIHFPPAFRRAAARQPGSNEGRAPLGVVLRPPAPFDWKDDRRPVHDHDAVIYELHTRGFTHDDFDLPEARRGTFLGLIDKIDYLRGLGVTVVELLPVQQFDPDEGNYWGYMPLHFFSPHHAYCAAQDPAARLDEFRTLVRALHAADIEVVLDVVYNHTTEGGDDGPTYSFRGIDNTTYYLMEPGLGSYADLSGTGNVFRTAHAMTRRLVLDSLRFWAEEMHVDGFRFDLATVLTRRLDGTLDTNDPAVISDITADPALSELRLVAEAWDLQSDQLGHTFPGRSWQQWNGRYRDDVRRFVKADRQTVPAMMRRLYGSDDLFPDQPTDVYRPFQSVNYVTSHDGPCLYDLVAFNSDRHLSWNCGARGDPAPADVMCLRRRQAKNLFALLAVANGVPMFVAGDEFLRTQGGAENPYDQDNATSWVDWSKLRDNAEMVRFVRGMIAFRKAHPTLARGRFWRDRVRWYGVTGETDLGDDSHALAFCLHGATDDAPEIYVLVNASWQDFAFSIQEGGLQTWRVVADTGLSSPKDLVSTELRAPLATLSRHVVARSVVILEAAIGRSPSMQNATL